MDSKANVEVLSKRTYVRDATQWILNAAREAVQTKGDFSIALSGGTTPRSIYSEMASSEFKNQFPWDKIHFFWGDERWLAPSHERSNYKMVKDALFSKVDIPAGNIHPMKLEKEERIEDGAIRYENELRSYFGSGEEFPEFDLMLLGLGEDGHIASLFPGEEALKEKKKWVSHTIMKQLNEARLTLTFPVINYSKDILFLVTGNGKAEVLAHVLGKKKKEGIRYPSEDVKAVHGEVTWLLDEESAAGIQAETKSI